MPDFSKLTDSEKEGLCKATGKDQDSIEEPVVITGPRNDGIDPAENMFREIDNDETTIIVVHRINT